MLFGCFENQHVSAGVPSVPLVQGTAVQFQSGLPNSLAASWRACTSSEDIGSQHEPNNFKREFHVGMAKKD